MPSSYSRSVILSSLETIPQVYLIIERYPTVNAIDHLIGPILNSFIHIGKVCDVSTRPHARNRGRDALRSSSSIICINANELPCVGKRNEVGCGSDVPRSRRLFTNSKFKDFSCEIFYVYCV